LINAIFPIAIGQDMPTIWYVWTHVPVASE